MLRGTNTVLLDMPPRLERLDALQNVQYLRPYKIRNPELGPQKIEPPPEIIDGHAEFEVEDIIAHRRSGKGIQYLTRFKGYTADADEWLPAKNLARAPDILKEYHDRNGISVPTLPGRQRNRRGG